MHVSLGRFIKADLRARVGTLEWSRVEEEREHLLHGAVRDEQHERFSPGERSGEAKARANKRQ
jgi:hypothetical protein